jgi:hypothetical protein
MESHRIFQRELELKQRRERHIKTLCGGIHAMSKA